MFVNRKAPYGTIYALESLEVVLIAATWVAQEWIRGNLFTGLPWLFVGHTQTPVLAMCQVADLASAYGVTFWVVLVNAWVALFVLRRLNPAGLVGAGRTELVRLICGVAIDRAST